MKKNWSPWYKLYSQDIGVEFGIRKSVLLIMKSEKEATEGIEQPNQELKIMFICLGFMAYQHLSVIKCQIQFYTNKHLYFNNFSFVKFLFQAIQFSQTVLFQTIQFSISSQFHCQNDSISTIQFSLSMQFKYQNSSISSNSL